MDYVLATIVGTVTYLVVGYIVFELILGTYTKENTLNLKGFNKSDKDTSMPFLVLSCLAYAILITVLVANWSRPLSFLNAYLMSGVVGSLVALMANSYWYSTTYLYKSIKPLLADVVAAFITVGALGAVISLII